MTVWKGVVPFKVWLLRGTTARMVLADFRAEAEAGKGNRRVWPSDGGRRWGRHPAGPGVPDRASKGQGLSTPGCAPTDSAIALDVSAPG
jgi:hypothetical protein